MLDETSAKPRGMAGAKVRRYDVPSDNVLGVVDDVVEELLDEGWRPGQIALLPTQHRHPEQRNAVEVGGYAEDPERAKEMLYVGLSRARTLLVVVGSRVLLEQVGGGGVRSRLKAADLRQPPR